MPRHQFNSARAPGQLLALNLEILEDRTVMSSSGSLLVTFYGGVNVAIGQAIVRGTSVAQTVGNTPNLYLVNVNSGTNANDALTAFQADPAVKSAEINSALSI